MRSSIQVAVKSPHSCSDSEIEEFMRLVCKGEEVSPSGLKSRILSAQRLVFLYANQSLQGTIAVKHPSSAYRNYVSSMSNIDLDDHNIVFELGWLFVLPTARGSNYALQLIRSAMLSIGGEGVFATSRRHNIAHLLSKFDFTPAGDTYPSDRDGQPLQLFIRPPASPLTT